MTRDNETRIWDEMIKRVSPPLRDHIARPIDPAGAVHRAVYRYFHEIRFE